MYYLLLLLNIPEWQQNKQRLWHQRVHGMLYDFSDDDGYDQQETKRNQKKIKNSLKNIKNKNAEKTPSIYPTLTHRVKWRENV